MKTMKKFSKKLVIGGCAGAVALGLVFASGIGSTAQAAGGCPGGGNWILVVAAGTILPIDVGNKKDQNGDGLVCIKANKGLSAKPQGLTFVVKDNTN